MGTAIDMNLQALWNEALPYAQFVREAEKNCGLWEGVYRTAMIPRWAADQACQIGPGIRLLVIAEDWCGDASNTVPVLVKLGDQVDCLEVRVIRRYDYPDVMDRYLTGGARAVPIVIALDANYQELGHWGPRPAQLQAWVLANLDKPSTERYKHARRWYAKDRGESTLREVLGLLTED